MTKNRPKSKQSTDIRCRCKDISSFLADTLVLEHNALLPPKGCALWEERLLLDNVSHNRQML